MDGFLKGKLGYDGIGGILRDSNGDVLCMFFVYIGVRELNEIEFLVIVNVFEVII